MLYGTLKMAANSLLLFKLRDELSSPSSKWEWALVTFLIMECGGNDILYF